MTNITHTGEPEPMTATRYTDNAQRGFAIETRYHGPTDHKGSRISVRCPNLPNYPTRFFAFDYAAPCAHAAAVEQYLTELLDYQKPRWAPAVPKPVVFARATLPTGYIYTAAMVSA